MKYAVMYRGGTRMDSLLANTLEEASAILTVGRIQYPALYEDAEICELRPVKIAVSEAA